MSEQEINTLSFPEKCKALLGVEKAINGLADRAREIAGLKRDLDSQQTTLREAIAAEMQADGVTSAEECGLVFALQNVPVKVIITDENAVPEEYFKTVKTLDKTAVNKAVKEGKTLPGTSLSNGGQILAIRAKGRNS